MAGDRTFAEISEEHKTAWDSDDFNAASALVAEARAEINTRLVNKTVRQNGDGTLTIVDKPE